MTIGMDRFTGKPLKGLDHLRQSVVDILTTRTGLRVMLRDYGSNIANLIDSPSNQFLTVDLYVAIAEAFTRWEPRIKLQQISYNSSGDGSINFSFTGIYLPNGEPLRMEGLTL